ncbi:serine/threonine-protein kinase mos isoform X2 [Orussus abietinus]|uniref:serine/threonine-protein kinase mos isoform X2 n=1 Tax=Orussus abietinus TaxID=222816 RepID=UPI0006268A26|nr:serine/threonine-protein kinase mos isoform X2 [Orussus abietinus]
MASPRALASVVRTLSPSPLPLPKSLARLSPRSPAARCSLFPGKEAGPRTINLDTPQRRKILKEGLPKERERAIIGSGGFGLVVRASYKGSQIAAKMMSRNRRSDITAKAEKLASTLNHENIIKIRGIEQGSALTLIAMELCGTSLEERLEETEMVPRERVEIWLAIARALKFCHEAGVIHADVKPKNILIGPDGRPKLADFGSCVSAEVEDEKTSTRDLRGTPGYSAPEVVRGGTPSSASDIFSLGVVAWQMVSRKRPFLGLDIHAILYLSGNGARPENEDLEDGFGGRYKNLYRHSWKEDPGSRPTATEVIARLNDLLLAFSRLS